MCVFSLNIFAKKTPPKYISKQKRDCNKNSKVILLSYEKQGGKKLKSKKVLYIIGVIVLIAIVGVGAYFIGTKSATATIENEVYSLDNIRIKQEGEQKELDNLIVESENKETEISGLQSDLSALNTELKEAQELISTKETIEKEIAQLKTDKESKDSELKIINENIATQNTELERLEHTVIALKKEPREIPAGQFVVGTDLEPGRYRIEPVSGQGNYFVNGGGDVNIILGNSEWDLSEYVLDLNDGDSIDQTLPVKYTAVE